MALLKAAPEDQALLLDLQELDTRLQQLDHRARVLPELEVLAGLRTRHAELTATLTARTGAWEDAQTELKRVEADVAVVEARMARDRERLQATSSTKDVQALEQELDALRKRRGDLEDIELEVMQTVEDRAHELDAARAELASLDASIAESEAAKDAALADLDAERRHAAANRSTIAGKVPADLLALYEKQRDRYGVGASMLRGGVSSATGVMLGASDMNAVRSAAPDDVLLCPDSSAILVRTAESGL
ncbi:MAG TPA: hypothetical protein VN759_11745 [Pseudolysinimonas sp.]|nr:hypothetical protein [Pseudolysinimonas sp.]